MRFHRLVIPAFSLMMIAFTLQGCGQKGPLVPPKVQFNQAPATFR